MVSWRKTPICGSKTSPATTRWTGCASTTSPRSPTFGGTRFEQMRAEALEVLDTEARIPYVRRRGDYLYNFWRDAANPRGLWRRTTLDSYRTTEPDWDVIFDVDALADAEDENWVWAGAEVLEPDHSLALIKLSRGGADATVVREFDMEKRQFVAGRIRAAGSEVGYRRGRTATPYWSAPNSARIR